MGSRNERTTVQRRSTRGETKGDGESGGPAGARSVRASRILICSTAHQPPLRLSPNLVRSRTSSPKPVNRSRTYAQRLREIGKLRCQSAFLFLFLVLDHDSHERASIIVSATNELISFRENRFTLNLRSHPLNGPEKIFTRGIYYG